MSNYKTEQTTTIHLEQMLFGGLAKVLIPWQTENGVLKNMDIRCPLTMSFSKPKLKILINEMIRDEDNNPIEFGQNYRDIINFDTNHPNTNEREILGWRETIWNFSMYRSLEIWEVLSPKKIEASLGELSKFGQSSLKALLSEKII